MEYEGIGTTEYRLEEEESEIREAIEAGRRYKIAAEVWREFLANRREEIVRLFEADTVMSADIEASLAELRVMKKFRDMSWKMIDLGDLAERRLSEIGS